MTSSRSSDLGTPSLLMASIRAPTFSMEARVSARRSCGERDLADGAVDGGLAGASTSMATAVGSAAMDSAGAGRERRWPGVGEAEVSESSCGFA